MGLVVVAAEHATRRDDPDRRLLLDHRADLHRRGVRPQEHARAILLLREEEGVHLEPGRVLLGEVQPGEVVVVGLDMRALGDAEAHIGEDNRQLVHHLADRMNAAFLNR